MQTGQPMILKMTPYPMAENQDMEETSSERKIHRRVQWRPAHLQDTKTKEIKVTLTEMACPVTCPMKPHGSAHVITTGRGPMTRTVFYSHAPVRSLGIVCYAHEIVLLLS